MTSPATKTNRLMTDDFLSRLRSGDVLVSDGATGTNLQAMGLAAGKPAEEWVIERPDSILSLHRAFVSAGSDIILTCSFSGNRLRLGKSPYADRTVEMNQSAARLARKAAEEVDRPIFVGGSMGPSGDLIEPYGTLKVDDVTSAFAEQAAALESGGADFLILETFFAIEEARAAIGGIRSASALPLICSFSYDRGTRTMMGVSPKAMAEAFADDGLVAMGANCGTTPENMQKIVTELVQSVGGIPIWAKPNAGLPEGSPPVYRLTPEQMGAHAVRFLEEGAQVVGGCCGSSPEHVAAIVVAVRDWQQKTGRK